MGTTTYAALLRGVNVGGGRKVLMADLRALLTERGYGRVRTHLQSGNVVLDTDTTPHEALAEQLSAALAEHFGLHVDVLVRDHAYLAAVADACPFPADTLEGKQLHVTYYSHPVDAARFAALDAAAYHPEEFALGDRALYLHTPEGLGRSRLAETTARLTPAREGIVATTRNWNTVRRLVELTAP
ncbi:DUF1697 domain-containing protein [Streptomyces avicenniae]|uniref:DUF1697 domain-containing protein n=1 Tax=Streptomyces avicenniae TaxID=500153 RepID=UPI000699A614|nr:DUF1697 domain-containing protein [Streptomyces avicenniae]